MSMSKFPADIELQIFQYLEPTEISNYYTSLNKSMPPKIISFFFEKSKKEGYQDFKKEIGVGKVVCICQCNRLKTLPTEIDYYLPRTECIICRAQNVQ